MISNENAAETPVNRTANVAAVKTMLTNELIDLKFRITEIQAGKLDLTTQVDKELYISSTVINKDEIIMALGCGIFVEMNAKEALEFIDNRLADLTK
jgi:prefoldin subunit 5